MKIFYDTEFLEDGRTTDLISIGMVAEDGRELYLINEEIEHEGLYDRISQHSWLMDNVIPHLPLHKRYDGKPHIEQPGPTLRKKGCFTLDSSDNRIVSRRFIRNAVREFVLAEPEPSLWADYGAYDHVVLCQLFGKMMDLPKGFPMRTNDIMQEAERLGLTDEDLPSIDLMAQHNALNDARHNHATYRFLQEYSGGTKG